MKKLFRNLVVMAIGTVVFATNVYAAELSFDGTNADATQSHMHFIGDIDTNKAGRTATMFILKPNTVLDNTESVLNDNILFVDSASVEFEGTYEFEFDFKPDTSVINGGKCPVYVLCDDSIYKYEYEYKSWDEIKVLFNKIRTTGISYQELSKFFDILGIENDDYTDLRYTNTMINRINLLTNITDDNNGVNLLKTSFNNSKEEFRLLKRLNTLNSSVDLGTAVSEIGNLTGVTFSYGQANKEDVLDDLLIMLVNGTKFYNVDELKQTFDVLVTQNTPQSPGPGNGDGSSGSSGGRGSFVKLPDNILMNVQINKEIFDDLSSVEWARVAIEALYNNGIINGVGDNKFAPMNNIKREEFVKIVVIAFGVYDKTLKSDFADTNPDEWYSAYIASAKKAGIVNGISDTEFGLGKNITRQDMAVMLYKGAMSKGYTFNMSKLNFKDSNNVSDYAEDAVSALVSKGVINGYEDNSFRPKEFATRAQAAKMIYSLIGGDA